MKNWAKISDYLFFQEGPGVRNTQYTTSGVKLINVANLVDGNIDLSTSDRYISENEAYGRYKHFLVDEGDFIIASSGIKVEYFDQKMGFVSKRHLPLCMNTSTIRFKSLDKSKLNIRYFMYYLKSKSFKRQLFKQITGSAQLNFGPSHLKKMKFLITDLSSQNTIVSILDNIDDQIRNRKDQLIEYDQLIKSRFVEMFGDRFLNDYGWNTGELGEFVAFNNGKAHEQVIDKNGKYILVTSRAIASDFVDVRRTNALLFPLYKNDIVMVMSDVPNGQALAKCQLIEENNKYTLNQRICCFNNFSFNSIFLFNLLNRHPYFLSFNDGNSQTNLRKSDILNCDLIVPPIELQNSFAEFAEHIDKLKFAVQKSLDETQMLFDSLLQEYFG